MALRTTWALFSLRCRKIHYELPCSFLVVSVFLFVSFTFCEEKVFQSEEDFSHWFTYYYQHPEPQKIPAAIRYFCNSLLLEKPDSQMPMAAFLAALFRNDPAVMEETYREVSLSGSEQAQVFFLNAISLSNTNESKALIGKAKKEWTSEVVQRTFGSTVVHAPDDLLGAPVQDPGRLDMLWATFLATGEAAPVKKIISVLHLKEDGRGAQIVIGGAASWSLASNAYQHPRVYEICREELQHSSGITRKLLDDVLKEADEQKAEKREKPNTEARFPDLTLADAGQIVRKQTGPHGDTYVLDMELYDKKGGAAWQRAASYPPTFTSEQERKETVKLVELLLKVVEVASKQFQSTSGLAQRAANNYRMAVNLDIPDVKEHIASAKRYYELALKMSPKDAQIYELYGSFLCSVSECKAALPHLEQARALGSTAALFDLGLAYLGSDVPKATQYLEEYRKYQPADQRAEELLKAIRSGAPIKTVVQ